MNMRMLKEQTDLRLPVSDVAPKTEHPEPKSPDPTELVLRIRAGESTAEHELVERYSRGVHFLLLGLTGDPARAEDLHQETFRLALEKVRAGELREPEKLALFLRALARNLFIAEHRRSAKRPLSGDEPLAIAPDPTPGPLARLLAKENAAIVRRLLADLEPRRDREILLRFFVAEHAKEEICADFGLTSLHFNRVLHRARQRLKDLLVRYHKRQSLPADVARWSGKGAGSWTT